MGRGGGTAGSIHGGYKIPTSRIHTTVTETEFRSSFKARHNSGTCPLCGKRIRKYDRIFYRAGPKAMHTTCPD